jgi:hypothetical protein
MRMSNHPGRHSVVLWLVAFVVVFGGASLAVTAIGRNPAPISPKSTPSVTPQPTAPICRPDQMRLIGAFNDCGSIDRTNPVSCVVSPHELDVTFYLSGTTGYQYLIEVGIPDYIGPGDYGLTGDGVYLVVREISSSAYWQATNGTISVTEINAKAGAIDANLDAHDPAQGGAKPPLLVDGPWRCS